MREGSVGCQEKLDSPWPYPCTSVPTLPDGLSDPSAMAGPLRSSHRTYPTAAAEPKPAGLGL